MSKIVFVDKYISQSTCKNPMSSGCSGRKLGIELSNQPFIKTQF